MNNQHIFYMDESGTPDIPGNTSHYVLVALSMPVMNWRASENDIEAVKKKYGLQDVELHIAWMLRKYQEQARIPNFEQMSYQRRVSEVEHLRTAELLRLQRIKNPALYQQAKKNFRMSKNYIHLTYDERKSLVKEVASRVSQWGYARLFAECVDKVYFDPSRTPQTIDGQAFEQVVSRCERFLQAIGGSDPSCFGLLVHDNNETVSKKHTRMMKKYHSTGTMWTSITKIIETPFFVDSQLTSMIQLADMCAYSLRRYLENNESELFDLIFMRADRREKASVGVRHFTKAACGCKICAQHKLTPVIKKP
jgi:hypothetical protein